MKSPIELKKLKNQLDIRGYLTNQGFATTKLLVLLLRLFVSNRGSPLLCVKAFLSLTEKNHYNKRVFVDNATIKLYNYAMD